MRSGLSIYKKKKTSRLPILTFARYFFVILLGAGAEGVEGFFKGVGKGLLGLLVHPTGGVVDMVSFTLDGVRRLNVLYFNFFYHTST